MEFSDEDRKYIKKLIARNGYAATKALVDEMEKEMADDMKTMFKFNIFESQGRDYIFIDNLVSLLSKLEPFVVDMDLNEIRINTVRLQDETFVPLDQLIQLLKSIDPNVPSFNLTEIADYIEEKSKHKEDLEQN